MKTVTATLALLMFSGVAAAQNPDPSKWMCRNLSESSGFLYQGETIFGSQACRPIQQTAPAASAPATSPSNSVTETPKQENPVATPEAGAPPATAPTAPKGFVLEDGTPVHLVLSKNLSSADAVTGQTVPFEVVDDVIVNGFVVIPRGATAWATVTDAEHKRRMGRAGKLDIYIDLDISIDKVRLADGEKAMLRAVKDTKGGGHTGAMVEATVATSVIVWPAAPVTIPKGTNISAFVQGDVTLDESKFQRQLVVSK
jgi:hypothetical protein